MKSKNKTRKVALVLFPLTATALLYMAPEAESQSPTQYVSEDGDVLRDGRTAKQARIDADNSETTRQRMSQLAMWITAIVGVMQLAEIRKED